MKGHLYKPRAIQWPRKTVNSLSWLQVVEARGSVNQGEPLSNDYESRLRRGRALPVLGEGYRIWSIDGCQDSNAQIRNLLKFIAAVFPEPCTMLGPLVGSDALCMNQIEK